MSFTEKMDVLDLIIKILNEHEQKLDKITQRLEQFTDTLIDFSKDMGLNWPNNEEQEPETLPDHSDYLEEHR